MKSQAKRKKPDPTKGGEVTLEHVVKVHQFSVNGLAKLEAAVREAFGQMHQNHLELLAGLRSAEFNLRAHQKVLNAMSQDMGRSSPDVRQRALETVVVDGEMHINWPVYHAAVEADIAEANKKEQQAEQAAILPATSEENTVKLAEGIMSEAAAPSETEEDEIPEGAAVFGG